MKKEPICDPAVERAYKSLSAEDKGAVDYHCSVMMENFKKRPKKPQFGIKMARELLAKLYICYTHNGQEVNRVVKERNE